jgi:porphyrinogen peroxidase
VGEPTGPQAILTPISEATIFLTLTVDAGAEDSVRDPLADVSGLISRGELQLPRATPEAAVPLRP